MLDNPSNIRYIGRGFVAANKERGTDMVEVWPAELMPELNDDLTPATQDLSFTGISCDKKPYRVQLKRGFTLECKWYGDKLGNRVTAPDVRRGERVNIYQVGDSELYYWESLGIDQHLRRLETIIETISDIPDNDDTVPDDTNTWTIEKNTHEGHITIRTTQSNGEKAAWTVQIDGADGKVVIEDQKGNHIFVDSVEDHIQLRNAQESFFELNKTNITAECKETFRLKCKDAIIETETTKWTNGKSWDLNTDTFKVNAGSTAELVAGSSVTIQGSVIKLN
jgi:hypothetical protein